MITELKITQAHHKGEDCLFLHFHKDPETIFHLKSRYGAKWSQTNAAWYIRNQGNVYTEIEKYCAERRIYFVEQGSVEISKAAKGSTVMKQIWLLNESSRIKLEKFEYWLRSKRYSENTIKTYTDAVRTFLQFHYPKEISEIDNEDVVAFNNEYIIVRNLSSSYQNQVVNALKLLLTTIDKRTINIELIHRPKREKKLPNVLSKEEIKLILNAPSNYKHRAMLSLIYSCGLRCGELLRLKPEDIDSKRGLVLIRQAKGKKDRVAPLSCKILEMLRSYYKAYRPQVWLFEGQRAGEPYSEKSLQLVLKQSLEKSGIGKPVTLHWLRHSYATHLLEGGTDLRYIQELLGHNSSRTTEIYTHVSTKNIQQIKSPFDDL